MKQLLCIIVFIGTSLIGFAQTKLISHKSHSGSSETFGVAVENELFDMNRSSFGARPEREVVASQLDSVIFLSKNKAIMITSEYCRSQYRPASDTVNNKKLWQARRDTVYNHQLFSQKHSLDSIKLVLKTQYNFQNEIDKVIFIGYDNDKKAQRKEKRKDKKGDLPIAITGGDNGFPPKGIIVLALAFISVLIALLSWNYYKRATTLKTA